MGGKKAISYLRAGYLLHLITLLELVGFSSFFYFIDIGGWLGNGFPLLKLLVLSPSVGMPVFAQLDARSRYQNYKLIKDNLYIHGFQKRMLRPFVKSRCQRDAIKAAADELGMVQLCHEFFKSAGYRWYHLLPDVVFDKPSVLLTKNFWITTIFEKTYRPKVKFERRDWLVFTKG